MAPRRGAPVVEEDQPGQLTWKQGNLSWRAGKPIATAELLKRLDALSTELRDMDQEETVADDLKPMAQELAGPQLMNHKDKGVRAITACCLVDVLKLCAPDAPFTSSQLKEIFMLLITSIVPALSDPTNAYNTQHKYVLASLAEVKSIVLLTDLPNHEDLLLHIFDNCFDIISGSARSSTGETISKDVEYNMTQILVTLVDESQSLPGEVVESIMAQFLRVSRPKDLKDVDDNQSTLLLKELPEAYNMARTICNSCPEKMARYVSQYFNDVIMEVTGADEKSVSHRKGKEAPESEDEDGPVGPTEAGMQELHKAHDLLRELWRASPAVLQNVIPQLEAELSAENVGLRLLATETLGDIISGIGAAGPPPPPIMDPAAYPPVKLEDCPLGVVSDSILTTPSSPQSFAQTHATVYSSFMSRNKDKSPIVRAGWATSIGRILVTSAGGIGLSRDEEAGLIKGLNEKLIDGDERVRLAAVKVIGGFGFRDIITRLVPNGHVTKPGSVLSSFADRIRDRKHPIRAEAMAALGRMWGVATGEILAGNTVVIENLGGIPSKIFDAFYANDKDINVLLDHVMFEQLLPLSYPPTKSKKAAKGDSQAHTNGNGNGPIDSDKIRTERILLLVKSLDLKASKAFFAMQARQPLYHKVLEAFLKLCEENNGGVIEKEPGTVKTKLNSCIKWFSDNLPDPLRITQDLNKYAKLHDRRSYQLLRFAMAAGNDFNTVHKAIKEFRKRFSAKDSPAGILDTFNPIIYRCSSLIYNISHQPVIMQFSRTDDSGLGATANTFMKEISDKHPEIFQASVKELCKAIVDSAPSETKANDPGSVDFLKALASFAKDGNNKIPSDRKFVQALKDFALYGTPAKVAKYAISILTTTERKELHLKDLLDKSVEDWTYGSKHFLTKLATLSQLTLMDPKSTEDASDEILDITTTKVLLKTQTAKSDDDPEWQADGEVDQECEAKSWALKTLVNRLRTTEDAETAKKLSIPVFKVLNALIVKDGELSKQNDTPKHHKARLRLLAAQQMLKVCTIKMFDDLLSPVEFNRLSFVAQDHLEYVRRGFIEKLQKYIVKNRLPNRFLTIIFLTTFEPSLNFRNSVMTWIRSQVKLCADNKNRVFEAVFPRLIHLLAHHPDYTDNPEELADNAKYILYYLTTVSSEANISHIYKYAERVKQARDALPGADSDRLYLLSDLAQMLIRKWQEKKGWNLQTWPAKVGMPVGLFAGLPSHEVAQEIAEKNYLPDEMEGLLDDLVRKSETKKQKRKLDHDDSHPSKKQKSERTPRISAAKGEKTPKPVKEKKTPKPKKSRADIEGEYDTPVPSSAAVERRKSGRGLSASAKKVYVDRDSDEDDEEMLDGVAEWEYFEENGSRRRGRIEKDDTLVKSDAEEEQTEEEEAEEEEAEEEKSKLKSKRQSAKRKPSPVEAEPEIEKEDSPLSEPEPEPEVEVDSETENAEKSDSSLSPEPEDEEMPDADDEAEEPVQTRSLPPRAGRKKATKKPAPKTKTKAKAPVAKPAAKVKVSKAKGKGKGKGKGKSAANDVHDMEESE